MLIKIMNIYCTNRFNFQKAFVATEKFIILEIVSVFWKKFSLIENVFPYEKCFFFVFGNC